MNILDKIRNGEKEFFIEARIKVPTEYVKSETVKVQAKNFDEAKEKCKTLLETDGYDILGSIQKRFSPIPAIIFFSIVFIMTWPEFSKTTEINLFFIHLKTTKSISLFPDFKSLFISILLYSGFIIRSKGIKNTFSSIADTVVSLLFIIFLAIFIQPYFSSIIIKGSFFAKLMDKLRVAIANYILIAAIALSWIGIKQIASFAWIFVYIIAFFQLISIGEYFNRVQSIIFLFSSLLGVVFYFKYEEKVILNLFSKAMGEIKSNVDTSRDLIRNKISNTSM